MQVLEDSAAVTWVVLVNGRHHTVLYQGIRLGTIEMTITTCSGKSPISIPCPATLAESANRVPDDQ